MSAGVKVVGERFYYDKSAKIGSMTVRCPHGKPYWARIEKKEKAPIDWEHKVNWVMLSLFVLQLRGKMRSCGEVKHGQDRKPMRATSGAFIDYPCQIHTYLGRYRNEVSKITRDSIVCLNQNISKTVHARINAWQHKRLKQSRMIWFLSKLAYQQGIWTPLSLPAAGFQHSPGSYASQGCCYWSWCTVNGQQTDGMGRSMLLASRFWSVGGESLAQSSTAAAPAAHFCQRGCMLGLERRLAWWFLCPVSAACHSACTTASKSFNALHFASKVQEGQPRTYYLDTSHSSGMCSDWFVLAEDANMDLS